MTDDERLFQYLLRLGDSPLILAQRLGEWVGKGPVLEEDIASTNVGLDLLGQARLWLAYAGEVEARGHYDFGAIDWDEFYNVIKGNGPCNRDRLRTRVKAWEDGAWVREAAMAHAAKTNERAQQRRGPKGASASD
jgi:1,2-phenylacetyl-CoA epoxidase catalytic subunit